MEVEITMILEIIISNLLTMAQWRVETLVVAGTWEDHMVEETMVLEEVEEVGAMVGRYWTSSYHGLHCINRRGWEPRGNRTAQVIEITMLRKLLSQSCINMQWYGRRHQSRCREPFCEWIGLFNNITLLWRKDCKKCLWDSFLAF